MRSYLKNNRAKFHPDPIWNDRALGFLKSVPQHAQQKQQQDAHKERSQVK